MSFEKAAPADTTPREAAGGPGMTMLMWGAVGALALFGALMGNWWCLCGSVGVVLIYRHWPGSSVGGVALAAAVLVFALGVATRNFVLGAPFSALAALAGAAAAGVGLRQVLTQRTVPWKGP